MTTAYNDQGTFLSDKKELIARTVCRQQNINIASVFTIILGCQTIAVLTATCMLWHRVQRANSTFTAPELVMGAIFSAASISAVVAFIAYVCISETCFFDLCHTRGYSAQSETLLLDSPKRYAAETRTKTAKGNTDHPASRSSHCNRPPGETSASNKYGEIVSTSTNTVDNLGFAAMQGLGTAAAQTIKGLTTPVAIPTSHVTATSDNDRNSSNMLLTRGHRCVVTQTAAVEKYKERTAASTGLVDIKVTKPQARRLYQARPDLVIY
ncbi:hypothetical protein ANPL_04470 [Anaplasma platys]|uniref:Uncharacterized protein n=1 Tax=Anaplasma platys TaxID=949 RepID=A0A858PZE8_9RICK|nr:hypothetical protein [Anaplasma platys]QJC27937.1 hypothetical protein ANPL_04470 [Anaplasma platys]